jgi:MarR family transcriptional regulator, organic hydroperoxide resistance regulator
MHSAERDDQAAAVLDSLRRIVNALRATAHTVERDLGISGAQLFVLLELAAEPHVSIRRLSERTLTDPSSVSVVAARLVARGLVARRRDPQDGRRGVLSLTARGERLLARAPEPFQARLVRVLRRLPRARLGRLNTDLGEVVRAVGVGGGAAPMFFDAPRRKTRRGA